MKKFAIVLVALTFVACGKKPAASSSSQPPATATSNVAGDSDLSKTLDRLTQAVRKYAAETRSEPKSLNDLVAAGYLSELPEAPAGKKYVIDGSLRVQLQ
jgi:hypothetical protein